jgi:hypothetical protein
MLVVVDDGGVNEVYHIMEKAPISWGPILILENIVSTMALYSKVVEHELALVNAWRSESSRNGVSTDQLVAALKSLGYSPDKSRYSVKQAHLSTAEEMWDETGPEHTEDAEPEAQIEFGDSNDEQILRQAYATLKERKRPPPTGGYPFPKDTKLGKLPPGPCRLCGSEKHWNRECSHYVVYSEGVKRNAKLVSVAEPSAEETMYQSAFSVLLNQTLAKTGLNLEKLGGAPFFEKAIPRANASECKTSSAKATKENDPEEEVAEKSKRKLGFAGIEEVEDEDEKRWKAKPKSEFNLLEEVDEVRASETEGDRSEAEKFWLNEGRIFVGDPEERMEDMREVFEKEVHSTTRRENPEKVYPGHDQAPSPVPTSPFRDESIRLYKKRRAKAGRSAMELRFYR